MPRRIRIVHWKPAEAAPLIGAVRAAGFEPEYGGDLDFPALSRAIHANLPDAVLIDLSRLPSHGREIEIWLRGIKATRNIPLLFANGEDAKRERVRKDMPDATFTTTEKLGPSLQAACLEPVRNPIVSAQMMERQKDRPTALKLGISPSSTVAVINAPRDYPAILGRLPENVELVEDPSSVHPVTLWFIVEPDALPIALRRMRALAAQTKLWIVWRKGPRGRVPQNAIREAAIQAGLVDYKICSLDAQWSGILVARKKT